MQVRKILPHIVTLLLAATLVLAQQVWASPLASRLGAPADATSKTTINYQGYLADSGGAAVNGPVSIVFSLYAVETSGAPLWSETQNAVTVTDGLFSVLLGSVTPLGQSLFDGNPNLWLGVTVGADEEMTPREKLSSAPFALSGGVPAGVIVMWSGPQSAIPDGWVLCDGQNGTPDLRDTFALGAQTGQAPGGPVGSHTKTLSASNLPAHTHPLTIDAGGAHTHGTRIRDDNNFEDGSNKGGADDTSSSDGITTTSSGNHTHTGTAGSTGSGAPIDVRPRYYVLAFIMKR
jgi:microcystin-dependent protein